MQWIAEASRADVIPHSSLADGPKDGSSKKCCPVEANPPSYVKILIQNHLPITRMHLRSDYALSRYFADVYFSMGSFYFTVFHFILFYFDFDSVPTLQCYFFLFSYLVIVCVHT